MSKINDSPKKLLRNIIQNKSTSKTLRVKTKQKVTSTPKEIKLRRTRSSDLTPRTLIESVIASHKTQENECKLLTRKVNCQDTFANKRKKELDILLSGNNSNFLANTSEINSSTFVNEPIFSKRNWQSKNITDSTKINTRNHLSKLGQSFYPSSESESIKNTSEKPLTMSEDFKQRLSSAKKRLFSVKSVRKSSPKKSFRSENELVESRKTTKTSFSAQELNLDDSPPTKRPSLIMSSGKKPSSSSRHKLDESSLFLNSRRSLSSKPITSTPKNQSLLRNVLTRTFKSQEKNRSSDFSTKTLESQIKTYRSESPKKTKISSEKMTTSHLKLLPVNTKIAINQDTEKFHSPGSVRLKKESLNNSHNTNNISIQKYHLNNLTIASNSGNNYAKICQASASDICEMSAAEIVSPTKKLSPDYHNNPSTSGNIRKKIHSGQLVSGMLSYPSIGLNAKKNGSEVGPIIQIESKTHANEFKKARKRKPKYVLPSVMKNIFSRYTNLPVACSAWKCIERGSHYFFKNLIEDLCAFSDHGYKGIIGQKEMLLLMKRQRLLDKFSLNYLAEQHLSLEYREKIISLKELGFQKST